ncbi:RNA-binding domain-containing protein [Microvirga zambiensis]|uniref:RNA-binding domain-containing protein n=1 Tax=Microvirga zambiensis TaxID=1402137 RepID=UPI00191C9A08|nr:RNA-binding domain-containing protein [Microvirga zambiensis]
MVGAAVSPTLGAISNPEAGINQLLLQVRTLVDIGALNRDVMLALFRSGQPYDFETALWDYKEKLPALPERPTGDDRDRHKAELGDIIKDVVSFHNSYGGYIVFGVADKGKDRIKGCNAVLDCGDLNKRIQSYTETSIECAFQLVPLSDSPDAISVGLLLVPRRPTGAPPVRFRKRGPTKPNGDRSFGEETYVRFRDECRPATATSEDWQFLHSDRSPPDVPSVLKRREVRSHLPARDPDLIEFVGREQPLASLRSWLTDKRSPIRLVSGIGGVGKTTLAYRFAEEVVDTAAGEAEWVIWLTAKQQTFSTLQGRLVPMAKVDFTDLESLLHEFLRVLSYDISTEQDEDELTLAELTDRAVEALSTYTCLLIVDDIDSLDPAEQKETVAALSAMAQRTVGRDIASSRLLMTSRIDQGLPPTAVVKISGLERDAFEKYVGNLCTTFEIDQIRGRVLDEFYEASSGSPLFAAAIVRMVKLGQNLSDVVATWKGQDGEDVREFAFKREVDRLQSGPSRLMYAVLLLGETSINDLASVLDVTPKVARERISELQAYHLITTSTRDSGDTVIYAPNELVSITEIVKVHLGSNAAIIEKACARALERSRTSSRSIAFGVRNVLTAVDNGSVDQAIILAQDLRQKFPQDSDVAAVLGYAFMQRPQQLKDADRELETAHRLGSTRPDLLPNLIKVKTELQDWRGLYDLTKSLASNDPVQDLSLRGFLRACQELVSVAQQRGDHGRMAELSLEAVERISAKIARVKLEKTFFTELTSARFDFSRGYIAALERANPRAGDKLRVFDGIVQLAEADVILTDLVRVGVAGLQQWWSDVEKRPVVDSAARTILKRQLLRLEKIQAQLKSYNTTSPAVLEIDAVRHDLAHRGAKLSG